MQWAALLKLIPEIFGPDWKKKLLSPLGGAVVLALVLSVSCGVLFRKNQDLKIALAAKPKVEFREKVVVGPSETKKTTRKKYAKPVVVCPAGESAPPQIYSGPLEWEETVEENKSAGSVRDTRNSEEPIGLAKKRGMIVGLDQDTRKNTRLDLGYQIDRVTIFAGPIFRGDGKMDAHYGFQVRIF